MHIMNMYICIYLVVLMIDYIKYMLLHASLYDIFFSCYINLCRSSLYTLSYCQYSTVLAVFYCVVPVVINIVHILL